MNKTIGQITIVCSWAILTSGCGGSAPVRSEASVTQPSPTAEEAQAAVSEYSVELEELDEQLYSYEQTSPANTEAVPTDRCELDICGLRDRICDLSIRICDIAIRRPGDDLLAGQCDDAENRCGEANVSVIDECQCEEWIPRMAG